MSTRKELGRRLRLVRLEKGLTLKDVASGSGMSATHISEVERGKTSPTIGALQRIAKALDENVSRFVREESLPLVTLMKSREGPTHYFSDTEGEPCTHEFKSCGIPAGIMQIITRTLDPGSKHTAPPRVGEMVLVCTAGMLRITVANKTTVLREGDTLQFRLDEGYECETIGDEVQRAIAVLVSPTLIQI